MRAVRILALARTIRCAMVGVGTRKARAISSVERPPSVRRVRATCASVASAGGRHVKISRSLSSGTGASSSSAKSSRCRAISSCFCARRARRRNLSMALWRAVPISQATGLSGMPAAGHCSSATSNASCSASSATSKSPSTRISVARIRPCSVRKISSMRMAVLGRKGTLPSNRLPRGLLLGRPLSKGSHLDREARPHQRVAFDHLEYLVEVLGLHDAVAAECLLGLREGAVGDDRLAMLHPDGGGGAHVLQRIAAMVNAALSQLIAELHGLLVGRHPLLRGHLLPHLLVAVDEQYVAQVSLPHSARAARRASGAAAGR